MSLNFKKAHGFTLIELLVVISIIGALAGLSLVSFSGSQKQARDTIRKSDLKQYQSLLTGYSSKNKGFYPVQNAFPIQVSSICSTLTQGATTCPEDPKYTTQPTQRYNYCSSSSAASYALWGELESMGTQTYFVICGNGKIGTTTTQPTCGASFNCQLP